MRYRRHQVWHEVGACYGKASQGVSHPRTNTSERHHHTPIEGLWPLHIQHGREGGDDLEMSNDDLEAHDQGVLPLLEELDKPDNMETKKRHNTNETL